MFFFCYATKKFKLHKTLRGTDCAERVFVLIFYKLIFNKQNFFVSLLGNGTDPVLVNMQTPSEKELFFIQKVAQCSEKI